MRSMFRVSLSFKTINVDEQLTSEIQTRTTPTIIMWFGICLTPSSGGGGGVVSTCVLKNEFLAL